MVERKKLGDQLLDIEGKEGVEMKTLNDLCTLITKQTGFDYSNTIKPSLTVKREADTIPFIQNKDFEGTLINLNTDFFIPISVAQKFPKILLNDKILLVSISGRIGNVGLYEIRDVSFVGGAICVCRLNKDTNGRYVLYFLQSPKGQDSLFHSVKAASHANITVEAIRKTIIPLPPISEQERIVDILDTFTSSIDNLKQQIAQRRKQYEYYRDQLLDLEGKEGVEMKISDFCFLKAGKSISADEIFDNKTGNVFPCIGGNGIRGYVSLYSHEGSYPIIGRQGALCGCVNWITGKFYATEHAVVATGKENMDQRFIYYLFENADLNQYKTQGAQPGLSVAKLNEVKFIIPSLLDQQRIVDILDKFEASILNLEAQLSQREKQYEYYRNKLLTFE